jgi:hypothetical protein
MIWKHLTISNTAYLRITKTSRHNHWRWLITKLSKPRVPAGAPGVADNTGRWDRTVTRPHVLRTSKTRLWQASLPFSSTLRQPRRIMAVSNVHGVRT